MPNRITLLLSLILLSSSSYAQNSDTIAIPPFMYSRDFKAILDSSQDKNSGLSYQKILIRFLDNDSMLTKSETLALMIGFTENPHFKPLDDMEKETEIFDHNKKGEFHEAINKSRPFLQTHPLSLLVLREISFAYNRLSYAYAKDGKFDSSITYKDSSVYFMSLNDKIMEAMIYSGKGNTPETAIFSLGLADGEYFIPNVGYKIEKKDADWNKQGDFMEIIKAEMNDMTISTFFFNIQHAKLKIDDEQADESTTKILTKSEKKAAEKSKKEEKAKKEKEQKDLKKKEKDQKEKDEKEQKELKKKEKDQKEKEYKEKKRLEKEQKDLKEKEDKEKRKIEKEQQKKGKSNTSAPSISEQDTSAPALSPSAPIQQ